MIVKAWRYVKSCGIDPQNIAFLIPEFSEEWDRREEIQQIFRKSMVIRLPYSEWYINELLSREHVEPVLQEFFSAEGYDRIKISKYRDVNVPRRRSHKKKRYSTVLYRNGKQDSRQVLAKGVGLGFLGYRALVIAHKLKMHIPKIYGLDEGILFMEWIKNNKKNGIDLAEWPEPNGSQNWATRKKT